MKKSKSKIKIPQTNTDTSPYEILGLSEIADSTEIKKCYTYLIRKYSPENDPDKFMEIREAYDKINNPLNFLLKGVKFPLYKEKILNKIIDDNEKEIKIENYDELNILKTIFETPFNTDFELKTILKPDKFNIN